MNISLLLSIAQLTIAIFLIISILLQQRGTALGSSFGGEGTSYALRRGIEKKLFIATLFLGILFLAIAVLQLAI
ncbi:MAG: preprotein translocase subunit SecG [Candidatus Wildermuthbacteria bacterium]|nr:preprotein translocase subunit SecG [Candidatus Wildermuthbacteria bacterium]